MKRPQITTFILFLSVFLMAQHLRAQHPRKTELTIKTTAECVFCKQNIENKLSHVKGIRKVQCDYVTHEVYVVCNVKKISPNEIRAILSDMGYNADDLKANRKKVKEIKHQQ